MTENLSDVDVVSIDYLVANENYQSPDIIKIDVEGNELLVLEGMEECLSQKGPIVICEVHSHLGEKGNDVMELLGRYDYAITNLHALEASGGPEVRGRPQHVVAVKRTDS